MDETQITFPFEFFIGGVPVSLQASGRSRSAWQEVVKAAAKASLNGWEFADEGPLAATIFYFPDAEMEGDIDNIVKPILDALQGPLFVNDHQIERVVVQKFEPSRIYSFRNPSETLAAALSEEAPVVYIRLDQEFTQDGTR